MNIDEQNPIHRKAASMRMTVTKPALYNKTEQWACRKQPKANLQVFKHTELKPFSGYCVTQNEVILSSIWLVNAKINTFFCS